MVASKSRACYSNLSAVARQYLGCPATSQGLGRATFLGGVGGRSMQKEAEKRADAATLEAIAFAKLTLPPA